MSHLRAREDKVTDGGKIRDKILENSPSKNEEFFIVPKGNRIDDGHN